jgi:hypothetical protein
MSRIEGRIMAHMCGRQMQLGRLTKCEEGLIITNICPSELITVS